VTPAFADINFFLYCSNPAPSTEILAGKSRIFLDSGKTEDYLKLLPLGIIYGKLKKRKDRRGLSQISVSDSNRVKGWRKFIGSPKLQIIFHKRATKYISLLPKMTYKDKGYYESSPPCSLGATAHFTAHP